MKRAGYFAASLLFFGVTTLAAQNKSASAAPSGIVRPNYSTSNAYDLSGVTCPVKVRALQGFGYGLVKIRGEQPVEGPAQRIHLVLANPKSKEIAKAKVIVLGLSPKNRAKRVSDLHGATDLTRALEVTFAPEDANNVSAELVLPGFTSVISIELQSITYRDGTTWTVADHKACQVAPDPLMLIAGP